MVGLSHMETKGVSSAILSAVRAGVAEQLTAVVKRPFDGSSIQTVEKKFIETLGKSGASGLIELFALNDELAKAVIHDGQKHYRKYPSIFDSEQSLGKLLVLFPKPSFSRI
jgi:hypothetical protein